MAFKKRNPAKTTASTPTLPTIKQIQAYLEKKGWVVDYDWQGKILYYINPTYPLQEAKLTIDKSINNFEGRLNIFLEDIAKLENKAKIGLIEEITGTSKLEEKVAQPSVGANLKPPTPPTHQPNGAFAKGNKLAAIPVEIHMAGIRKHRHLIADRADELIKRAMDLALTDDLGKTNVNCLMDLLKLYLPTPKPVTFVEAKINEENLQSLAGVKNESIAMIKQLEGGSASVESIAAALDVLHAHVRFVEMSDIEPRMRELELQMSRAKG